MQFRTILVILSTYSSMHDMIIARLAYWLSWLNIPYAPLKWLQKNVSKFLSPASERLVWKNSVFNFYLIYACTVSQYLGDYALLNCFLYGLEEYKCLFIYLVIFVCISFYSLSTNLPRRHTQLLILRGTFFLLFTKILQIFCPSGLRSIATYVHSNFNLNFAFFKYNNIE